MTTAEPLIPAMLLGGLIIVLIAFLWLIFSSLGFITSIFINKKIKYLRNALKYYGTVKNEATPSMLKKTAYKGIAISFISIPAYIIPVSFLYIILTPVHFEIFLTTVISYTRLAVVLDIVTKIVFYYFSIKAIFVAKGTVMTDTPEPLPVVQKAKTTSSKYCPQCNKQINEALLFCTDCGCKLLNKPNQTIKD